MAVRGAGLSVVGPGDAPAASKGAARPKSVSQAAKSGTHRDLLVAMRERVAKAVEDPKCPPRDLAALTRRLQEIAKEIEAIDLRAKEEADDGATTEDPDWDAEAL